MNRPVYTLWTCATLTGKTRYKILTDGCLANGHPTFTSLKAAQRYLDKMNKVEA